MRKRRLRSNVAIALGRGPSCASVRGGGSFGSANHEERITVAIPLSTQTTTAPTPKRAMMKPPRMLAAIKAIEPMPRATP